MPDPSLRRPRHQTVAIALAALNAEFLQRVECGFGRGTRIVLELEEYRESEDLDFLCSSRIGYRTLRSAVTDRSLGEIISAPIPLAREVRADRYGIRTFLDIEGSKLKIELVNEGRIQIGLERVAGIPVPCLHRVTCMAEKFLANADHGGDMAYLARDVIDLAFMPQAWGSATAREGAEAARAAYGDVVDRASQSAAAMLLERLAELKRCATTLRITQQTELIAGLQALAAQDWAGKKPPRKRKPKPNC